MDTILDYLIISVLVAVLLSPFALLYWLWNKDYTIKNPIKRLYQARHAIKEGAKELLCNCVGNCIGICLVLVGIACLGDCCYTIVIILSHPDTALFAAIVFLVAVLIAHDRARCK
uniref:Uncharacterized protein n=1 Tax=viral metagenome TaxID=1070528 RepID=A0A6H1ZWK0_9ZZZZ